MSREPFTEAGRAVVEATASDPFIPDAQKPALRAAALRAVIAIEDEIMALYTCGRGVFGGTCSRPRGHAGAHESSVSGSVGE